MNLLKEPLLHFLILGGLLFGLDLWLKSDGKSEGVEIREATDQDSDQGSSISSDRVVVSSGRIRQLAGIFEKTWQRPPTRKEMEGLVDDFILEECYYRKAVRMGIDRDDTLIRRRLRQKLEFLSQDASSLIEPTDDDLASYLEENPDKFRLQSSYTFRQIYFNPEKLGPKPVEEVEAKLGELKSGGEVLGDATLLPEGMESARVRVVDGTFGSGFAAELDKLEPGEWSGPVASSFGLHLVKLDERIPGRIPELDEIREVVTREWAHARHQEFQAQFNEKILKEFVIEIQWPEPVEQP